MLAFFSPAFCALYTLCIGSLMYKYVAFIVLLRAGEYPDLQKGTVRAILMKVLRTWNKSLATDVVGELS